MMRHQPGIVGVQDAALSQLDSSWQPFAMGLLPLLWCVWERLSLYPAYTRWRRRRTRCFGICPDWWRAAALETRTKVVRISGGRRRYARSLVVLVGPIGTAGDMIRRNRSDGT